MITLQVIEKESIKPLWVFAYGSLMWNPGFKYLKAEPVIAHGYNRSFCIWSKEYRGTPESPGLVLGLEPGKECAGLALLVDPDEYLKTIRYLDEREITEDGIYEPKAVPLSFQNGDKITGLAYTAVPGHACYAANITIHEQAKIICQSHGQRGSNLDYAQNTALQIAKMNVEDPYINQIKEAIKYFL